MKIKFLVLTLFAIILTMVPFKAVAAEMSGGAGVDIYDKYVWRGIQLSDSKGVVQPSVDFAYGSAGLNFWSDYDIDTGELAETDVTLSYGIAIDKLTIDAGYIFYGLDGFSDTQEIYISLGYDIIGSPSVTYYQDIEEGTGGFGVLSIGHDIALTGDIALSLGASASVNFENSVMGLDSKGEDFTGLYNGEVSASISVPLPMDKNISISPIVAYSFSLSNDAKDAIESISFEGDSNVFYAGIGAAVGF